MSTVDVGRRAELAARVYLEMRGFQIIEQNWRRPRYEIDIIACKDNVMQLVEVKYRNNNDQGGGLEAITDTKLKQMRRAAWAWVEETEWHGEYLLSAIEVAGDDYTIVGFIENVY